MRLSNGRLICGVGVGWWAEEFAALGIPFHTRGRQADEMLRVFKELWTTDGAAVRRRVLPLQQYWFCPQARYKNPIRPLWVGGSSPGAFRRVVTLGDGWHATSQSPEQLRYSLERLQQAAEQAGRPLDTLTLSLRLPLPADAVQGSRQAIIDQYCAYKLDSQVFSG